MQIGSTGALPATTCNTLSRHWLRLKFSASLKCWLAAVDTGHKK